MSSRAPLGNSLKPNAKSNTSPGTQDAQKEPQDAIPEMGSPLGERALLETMISPVKDLTTAVDFLTAAKVWKKQQTLTMPQQLAALRRALVQLAAYAKDKCPPLMNALIALHQLYSAFGAELQAQVCAVLSLTAPSERRMAVVWAKTA
ncbi:hypothetical protein AURDEDRAFT_127743 [Auricularia subglabra TFB-10046 SS5]|nr:hypothetical protein AURDEDRAFT_127743 [Auricularia subglabra TFB-10046 SS5]